MVPNDRKCGKSTRLEGWRATAKDHETFLVVLSCRLSSYVGFDNAVIFICTGIAKEHFRSGAITGL